MSDTDRVPTEDDRIHQPGLLAAFRTRRRAAGVPAARYEAAGARDAYERGRRDERARHARRPRRHGAPLLSFVVLLVAVAGGAMIYLAAREGSFTAGGHVVDQALGQASGPARTAAANAGDALEHAGQNLKDKAGQTASTPPSQQPPQSQNSQS